MGEKKHPPSQRKLRRAAERGQVPRSDLFSIFLKVVVIFGAALLFSHYAFLRFKTLLHYIIYSNLGSLRLVAVKSFEEAAFMSISLLSIGGLIGTGFLLAERRGQIVVNKKAFQPSISPKSGISKIVRGVKGSWLLALKVVILLGGLGAYIYLAAAGGGILGGLSLENLINLSYLSGVIVFSYLVCAFVDLIYNHKKHYLDLRMDDRELRDEYKEQEGDPYLKGARKEIHYELLAETIERAVKKAKVVIVSKNVG